jgi:hypothetical protein
MLIEPLRKVWMAMVKQEMDKWKSSGVLNSSQHGSCRSAATAIVELIQAMERRRDQVDVLY